MLAFARIVSGVFSTLVLTAVLLLSTGWASGEFALGCVIVLVVVGVPAVTIEAAVRLGLISGWTIPERSRRWPFAIVSLCCLAVGAVLSAEWSDLALSPLTVMLCAVGASVVVVGVTGLWWKISAQSMMAGMLAGATIVAIPLLGLVMVPLAAAVAWSRSAIRAHTSLQAIVGASVGLSIGVAAALIAVS